MKPKQLLSFIEIATFIAILLLIGCGQSSSAQTAEQPDSYKYGYGGKFGMFDMADTAEAFSGNVLVGKARAIELQETPTGGAKMMKIEVTHYSQSGQPIYKGYVYIQAGFRGGQLIKTEDISGKKQFTMFGSWQFGH